MRLVEIAPTSNAVLDQIRAVVVASLRLDLDPRAIGAHDVLFDPAAGVDSVGAIELLVALEDAFGVKFLDEELDPAVLRSVDALAGLVGGALARAGRR